MTETLIKKVQKVYESTFRKGPPFSREASRIHVSSWDSLQHIHFLVGLEKEFSIRFDGATAARIVSIPAVLEEIERLLPS